MIAAGMAMNPDDQRSMAWLCEMAALGCLQVNRSAWAAQLRDDARALRQRADEADGRNAVAQATTLRRFPRS